MDLEVLIPLLAVFSIFFVPMVGIMVILTSKYALTPLVETLAKALKESGYSGPHGSPEQLEALTEQIHALTDEVRLLKEVTDFDQKLLGDRGES
jgi:hypothetical protein